jgi:hypothetical protein
MSKTRPLNEDRLFAASAYIPGASVMLLRCLVMNELDQGVDYTREMPEM